MDFLIKQNSLTVCKTFTEKGHCVTSDIPNRQHRTLFLQRIPKNFLYLALYNTLWFQFTAVKSQNYFYNIFLHYLKVFGGCLRVLDNNIEILGSYFVNILVLFLVSILTNTLLCRCSYSCCCRISTLKKIFLQASNPKEYYLVLREMW